MDLTKRCLDLLTEKGADKGEILLIRQIKHEMNVSCGEISLLRTREEYSLNMTAIIDQKKDFIQINKIDDNSIKEAVEELIKNAQSSQVDVANDISDQVDERVFEDTRTELDISLMHKRLSNFIKKVETDYPDLIIEEAILEYIDSHKYYQNTNGVKLSANNNNYLFSPMFFAKRGSKTSSFNYTAVFVKDLEKELYELGSIKHLLRESVEHLEPQYIQDKKFTGHLIITPDCLNNFLYFLLSHLSNYMLISGTSRFTEKINEKVLDEKFSLRTEPDSGLLAVKNYFGQDGIVNRNDYIFERGVLKNYLLDLYGSKKTGFDRGPSTGQNLIVECGDSSLDEIIRSTDKGIILSRFSGGHPSPNGDFSGVAKNSFYVEDGEIQYPIKETMISGNLFELFNNITGISKERINNGKSLLPYIQFKGVIISSG